MGCEGKFAFIVKKMGDLIISQNSANFEQTFMEDFYEWNDEEELPTMEFDESVNEIGMSYDDLKSGNNLTILFLNDENEIIVRYEGKLVYKEVANELQSFVPEEKWESLIEKIYTKAKIVDKNRKNKENNLLIKAANYKKKEIIEKLKDKWGI